MTVEGSAVCLEWAVCVLLTPVIHAHAWIHFDFAVI
jgi:hypothetical protein